MYFSMQERMRIKDSELKRTCLSQLMSELVISWPSLCELGELIEISMQQDCNQVRVSGHIVELSFEASTK